jgi:hypothetical protein
MKNKILWLRIIHGLFALYFTLCLAYLCYVAITKQVHDALFVISVLSLAVEGFLVFALNSGDCPLIHVQRRIGDDMPFFELFLPRKLAKAAIPIFAGLTMIVVIAILLRFVVPA